MQNAELTFANGLSYSSAKKNTQICLLLLFPERHQAFRSVHKQ